MDVICSAEELGVLLRSAQEKRAERVKCQLAPAFAAQHGEGQLRAMIDLLLHMAQGRRLHMHRQRDGSLLMGVDIRYREGVRMADAARNGDLSRLTPREQEALVLAREVAEQAVRTAADKRSRLHWLFVWLSCHVQYENLVPGALGYAELVGATGALLNGRANCQGFADAYALLCALAGMQCTYQCGWSGKGTHLWNAVHTDAGWYAVDSSRGSRLLRQSGEAAMNAAFLMDRGACAALGLRWDQWMETAPVVMEEEQ